MPSIAEAIHRLRQDRLVEDGDLTDRIPAFDDTIERLRTDHAQRLEMALRDADPEKLAQQRGGPVARRDRQQFHDVLTARSPALPGQTLDRAHQTSLFHVREQFRGLVLRHWRRRGEAR